MSPSYDTAPRTYNSLTARLRNIAEEGRSPEIRLVSMLSVTVVAQMLPSGVVKGGTALSLRGGPDATRFSRDIDAIRPGDCDAEAFVAALRSRLAEGWNGFTGTIRPGRHAAPVGVPEEDLMQPFEVKLSYNGRSVMTVDLELVTDEDRSATAAVDAMAPEIVRLFTNLGFPAPRPVPVLTSEYQIVQKLHACTTPDGNGQNGRSHDLVDIQLLSQLEPPNPETLNEIGQRVFSARGHGSWPPAVVAWSGWDEKYPERAEGTDVLPLDEAIAWANGLIAEAVAAGKP